ncbi:hypothetical protein TELCIR_23621 [Teladorsagia circumcincta]|uniref:Uncharacterized protein n=1 Tax=Teladorsagia circumcincta TaxID=45464 RepID=A0A2G9TAK7_TELCI|nr:hypothetical protein TELCIR_23621 [Teladorsagia circumcincta]
MGPARPGAALTEDKPSGEIRVEGRYSSSLIPFSVYSPRCKHHGIEPEPLSASFW